MPIQAGSAKQGLRSRIPLLLTLLLVASAANATVITTATCNGAEITGYLSASCTSGADPFASATTTLPPNSFSMTVNTTGYPGYTTSATAVIQDSFMLTVTGGLSQGYFETCAQGSSDFFQAQGGVEGGTFGNLNVGFLNVPIETTYCGNPTPFTAGVGQNITVSMSETATALGYSGPMGTELGFGDVGINGWVTFFDSSMNPAGVTYSLVDNGALPIPEPAAGGLVFGGLAIICGLLRRRLTD